MWSRQFRSQRAPFPSTSSAIDRQSHILSSSLGFHCHPTLHPPAFFINVTPACGVRARRMFASAAFLPPAGPFIPCTLHRTPSSRKLRLHRLRPRTTLRVSPPLSETGASPTPKRAPLPAPLPSGSRVALFSSVALSLFGAAFPAVLAASRGQSLSVYSTHYEMLALLGGFATIHSGLASLRPKAVRLIGERLYRVLFAGLSLPSAGWAIAYFIAHRYDGAMLWTLQGGAWTRFAVGVATAVSFALLYPATFDLLQVAAVRRPRLTIFEEGVMRVTRHPQLWGQVVWCLAHCMWIGSSFAVVGSCGLVAHHLFGVWNGDRRLRDEFGERWVEFAGRTSIVPFAAVVGGKQRVVWGEFVRPAYVGVAVFVWATYWAHPVMLRVIGEMNM